MPSTRLELSRMFGLRRGPQVRRYDLHHSPVTIMFVRLCLHPDGGLKRRRGRRQGVGWNENLREESEGRTTHVRGPPTDPVDHQLKIFIEAVVNVMTSSLLFFCQSGVSTNTKETKVYGRPRTSRHAHPILLYLPTLLLKCPSSRLPLSARRQYSPPNSTYLQPPPFLKSATNNFLLDIYASV